MARASSAEKTAVEEAGALLRYASENIENLDPSLYSAIVEARIASESESWSSEVAARFWQAFNMLCALAKPATIDSVLATRPDLDCGPLKRLMSRRKKESLAERSSDGYVALLTILITIIVLLQLYLWICTTVATHTAKLSATVREQIGPITSSYGMLIRSSRFPDFMASFDALKQSELLNNNIDRLNQDLDRLLDATRRLEKFTFQKSLIPPNEIATPSDKDALQKHYDHVVSREVLIVPHALAVQQDADLVVGVVGTYLLPVLFGTMGATAYVVRAISEEIRNTTFSTTSPVRHFIRVALGGLMGAVIGLFSSSTNQLTLPPLALAFLAGYGVEGVFGLFDGLIARLTPMSSTKGSG